MTSTSSIVIQSVQYQILNTSPMLCDLEFLINAGMHVVSDATVLFVLHCEYCCTALHCFIHVNLDASLDPSFQLSKQLRKLLSEWGGVALSSSACNCRILFALP